MTSFPILETDRFALRQLRPSDAKELFDCFSRDEVTQYYDLESFTHIEQAEELITRWNQRFENKQGFRWGITLLAEDTVIGTCGYHSWDKPNFKAEIGYVLAPEYWRLGVMTEVIARITAFGFNEMALNRIEAFVEPENIASRRVLEKVGFLEEGIMKEHFFWRNQFVDNAIYALLKSDFNKTR